MIIGVGVDTTDIERVKKACQSQAFIDKCFASDEIALLNFQRNNNRTYERAAGNFAAKEALMKALSCGMSGFELTDVSILRAESGAPYVKADGKAARLLDEKGVKNVFLSLTNEGGMATAFIVLEG